MSPAVRKLVLITHLTCSIGWLGAVISYVVLDLTVATGSDPAVIRSAWIAMGLVTSAATVPLAIASLVTGIAISVGTKWGLFHHWWVLISLVLSTLALVVLIVESRVIAHAALIAADPQTSATELIALPPTLPHSIGGLIVLLVIQTLNVYKPQGVTPYGWRKQQAERARRC